MTLLCSISCAVVMLIFSICNKKVLCRIPLHGRQYKRDEQDDLSARFHSKQNKDWWFHLWYQPSVQSQSHHVLEIHCFPCWLIYLCSRIIHTFLLGPYNPVSMTTRISSIRPGRGMICELRVNSHALAWTSLHSLPLFHSLAHSLTHATHTHDHKVKGGDFALYLFSRTPQVTL